jgi:hypothetical protein
MISFRRPWLVADAKPLLLDDLALVGEGVLVDAGVAIDRLRARINGICDGAVS